MKNKIYHSLTAHVKKSLPIDGEITTVLLTIPEHHIILKAIVMKNI